MLGHSFFVFCDANKWENIGERQEAFRDILVIVYVVQSLPPLSLNQRIYKRKILLYRLVCTVLLGGRTHR